ncbi:MAG: TonB-dependent receptor, partial [Bacteroidota bacterium]
GVRVRTSGSLGDRVDIALNGLNGTAVRVYMDGLPMEFLYPSLNLGNIPLNNIKRVDVYKGVLPVTIGTDAMGGGINLISDYKPYNSLQASYSIGSFNTHQAGLNFNWAIDEDLVFNFNSSYNYSDNDYEMEAFIWEDREVGEVERFNDQYELFFLDAGLVVKNKKFADYMRLGFSFSDFYKEIQHGGLVERLAYGEAAFNGNNTNLFLDYRKSIGEKFLLENFTALAFEDILFIDTTRNVYSWSGEIVNRGPAGEFAGASLSDRDQNSIANRTSFTYSASDNTKLLFSNLIARQQITGRDEVIPEDRDVLTQPQSLLKNVAGLELNQFLFNKKLNVAVAGKLYYFDLDGVDFLSFAPVGKDRTDWGWYGSMKYDFTNRFFARGSYERAWRIPNYIQFFGNGNNIISNIDLKSESSDNFNLGLAYKSNNASSTNFGIELNGFLREQNDIIFLSPNILQQYINAEEVRTIGIEGEFFVNFLEHFLLNLNVTRLRKTYQAIDENNINSQFLVGTEFPNTPSFFGNARLTYQNEGILNPKDGFRIYAQYKYVDEFNFINVGQVRNDDNWVPVQHRIDAGLTYTVNDEALSFSLNVNNLLDDQLFDNFKIPRPGRNFNLKVIYTINNF